jgi:UDP-N-acetylmuramoyl-L-alanyl-D-glutamate--2,6-diaminopimelate ligase
MGGDADCTVLVDRREAIRHAVAVAKSGDVIVVAGKGHEQGQTIGAETYPFDDVAESLRALASKKSGEL